MKRVAAGLCSLLLLSLFACPSQPSSTSDGGTDGGVIVEVDAGAEDAGPAGPSCLERCALFGESCEGLVNLDRCNAACADTTASEPTRACLVGTNSCEEARGCVGAYHPPPSVPFHPGPYGTKPRDVAGPFTLQTTDGPWSFDQEWTGDDHYVFVVHHPQTGYSNALFAGSVKGLLQTSPRNVHYFFLRAAPSQAFDAFVTRALGEVQSLPADDLQHWRTRVHFGDEDLTKATGWAGDLVRARINSTATYKLYDGFQWAIDRTQHVREVGMLGVLGEGGTLYDLKYLAYEPQYYEFEHARQQRLDAETVVEVQLLDNETINDWEGPKNWRDAVAYPEVTLPDAATMATFDTLEVDLSMRCLNNRDGDCGAWDYLANLYVCEELPPDGGTDGGTEMEDAGTVDAGTVDAGEPTFRDPRPGCDREIARWITTYWREGRWVTDISAMLPFLADGGKHTFRWMSKHQWSPREVPYVLSLSLRFSNRNKGMRPVELHRVWTEGGPLNTEYDARHPAVQFQVPPDVKKVELVSLVTGHGADTFNCSEFCNNTHHFRVNAQAPHSLTFPTAATQYGCRDRVGEGVVPNQSGTWYFGRAGWCPGWDVRPYVADVTGDLVPGTNEVTYNALIGNAPPEAGKNYGSIALSTYLVYWK